MRSAEGADPLGPPAPETAPIGLYALAVVLTVTAIASQYFVPQLLPFTRPAYGSIVGDFAIVYGIPLASFALLVGARPLRNWNAAPGRAAVEGLRWYGLLTLLGLVVAFVLLAIILALQPSAAQTLNRATPIVKVAEQDPWLWAALSFPVGFCEETIFRGFIFGYWLDRDPASWKTHAAWTSALFAGVHVYYALTYGIVFVVPAVVLYTGGFGFAGGMRDGAGNLVVVSLLHGWNDATAFIALASAPLGLALHYGVVLFGGLIGLIVYVRRNPPATVQVVLPPGPAPAPPPTAPPPTAPPGTQGG